MNKTNLSKSKKRIRDHGEVFTPDFIVEDMLNLVVDETKRIESRFLEPACGDGNFLIKVLEKKLDKVEKDFKRSQFEYEKNSFIAISSIYGVELLEDNTKRARERLYEYFYTRYSKLYKKKINSEFLKNIMFLLSRNIIQGDALTLKGPSGEPIVFSEWSPVGSSRVTRRDFKYEELANLGEKKRDMFDSYPDISDSGKEVYIAEPIKKKYSTVSFMKIYKEHE